MGKATTTLRTLALLTAMSATLAHAQYLKEDYIDWGVVNIGFGQALQQWEKGVPMSEDDNFFIARVKPKCRFRNKATQVDTLLNDTNDKRIAYWVPIGTKPFNALPDGAFDRDVFCLWPYITHFGNWTAPFVRMPGNFADVAHKNGVAVSVLAPIPAGRLDDDTWGKTLSDIVDAGADKMADFLCYYGIDGLGYNSEYTTQSLIGPPVVSAYKDITKRIGQFHEDLYKNIYDNNRNPIFENIWYDGTGSEGFLCFDGGLDIHNIDNFGWGEAPRASLFFNYNWNDSTLLAHTLNNCNFVGRNPLDIYCGFNMQGREPRNLPRWPMLDGKNLSIGLWGAHNESMLFESRGEQGASPDDKQNTYLKRQEMWFTGGTRNPAHRQPVSNSMRYQTDNTEFFGMSHFTTARSALEWDLTEEPFVTNFNLGNGKFFNWDGQRTSNNPWYNIGLQDHLPTWRWWTASSLLGRDNESAARQGLDAHFTWDDAWWGGSLLCIEGNCDEQYLHLFKTCFDLHDGDIITVRYKRTAGDADINLVLTANGQETTPIEESKMVVTGIHATDSLDTWQTRQWVVGKDMEWPQGNKLALIALHIVNARQLNLRLGHLSIVRGDKTATRPDSPVITRAQVLNNSMEGIDGKLIFYMPNDKPAGEPCYNIDVNTSMFKLYMQQEGHTPHCTGATTSWAALYFAQPIDHDNASSPRVRFGVSALSLDMSQESEIAWSEYLETGERTVCDDIVLPRGILHPGDSIRVAYLDPMHEAGNWLMTDSNGKTVAKADNATALTLSQGLEETGNYTITLQGSTNTNKDSLRTWKDCLQVVPERMGRQPQITDVRALTASMDMPDNDVATSADSMVVAPGERLLLQYSGRPADGYCSRGLDMQEKGVGFKAADAGMVDGASFAVAFWLKINSLWEDSQLLNIRDKTDKWDNTERGFFWHFINNKGETTEMTVRGSGVDNDCLYMRLDSTRIPVGVWVHMAYSFSFDDNGLLTPSFWLNGKRQPVTSWNRGEASGIGEPQPQASLYAYRDKNVVAVGGQQFSHAGIDGSIDNVTLWEKAIDSKDIAYAMGTINATASKPKGLKGLWTFEQAADSNGGMANELPDSICLQRHDYTSGEDEGAGYFHPLPMTFTSGCPWIDDKGMHISTTAQWQLSTERPVVNEAWGNDIEGEASLVFAHEGRYTATVSLENLYGKHSMTYPLIVVDGSAGIAQYPNVMADSHRPALLAIESAGLYTVNTYDITGRMLNSHTAYRNVGSYIDLGQTGTCPAIVQVYHEGRLIKSMKIGVKSTDFD